MEEIQTQQMWDVFLQILLRIYPDLVFQAVDITEVK
jgi:hypothetical protein